MWRWEGGGGEESREACVGGGVEGGDGGVCERGKCVWQGLGGCVEVEVYMGRRGKCCVSGVEGVGGQGGSCTAWPVGSI